MKIFIDSAMINEIEEAYSLGVLDGVTTNPSLIKKAAEKYKVKDMKEYIKRIFNVAKGTPVSLEVTEYTYSGMVDQGKRIYKMFKGYGNVFIKVPVNPCFPNEEGIDLDGIKAIKKFSDLGIPVNCTLVFTPEQALLAAKAGARFVSPFCGRVDDFIRKENRIKFEKHTYFPAEGFLKGKELLSDNGVVSGIDLVEQIDEIFERHDIKTEVLAASLRNSRQVREAALAGADIATLPLSVIKEMLSHHKTREGMAKFMQDVVPGYVKMVK